MAELAGGGVIYSVTVQPFGKEWLVRVPAFGLSGFVTNRATAPATATDMISRCGYAAHKFDIDVQWTTP